MSVNLIVVAGVSCAGKSTFIADALLPDPALTLPRVHFGGPFVRSGRLRQDAKGGLGLDLDPDITNILHINLLMGIGPVPRSTPFDVAQNKLLQALETGPKIDRLFLCYAPDAVILNRIEDRTTIEATLAGDHRPYPVARIMAQFEAVDQRDLVLTVGQMLQPNSRKTTVVFSGPNHNAQLTWDAFRKATPSAELEAALTGQALTDVA